MGAVQPASVGRRAAAGVVDVAVFGGAAVGALAAFVAVRTWRGGDAEDVEDARSLPERLQRPRVRVALQAVGLGAAVATRNSRTPGMRALGLRRADARSGGPVTVRSAIVAYGVNQGVGALFRRRRGAQDSAQQTCLRSLPSLLISLGPAVIGPDHRSLASRMAGMVVVKDR